MYDKAIEEIKEIFEKNFNLGHIFDSTQSNIDKDLSDFLKRFEEGFVERANEELSHESEPDFDRNDLD